MSLSPAAPPALSLSTLIWRYVRQFVKIDAKEAMQYVYCVCLTSDQGNGIGKEQVETAWELTRRIIVLANSGPAWEELVGVTGSSSTGDVLQDADEVGSGSVKQMGELGGLMGANEGLVGCELAGEDRKVGYKAYGILAASIRSSTCFSAHA